MALCCPVLTSKLGSSAGVLAALGRITADECEDVRVDKLTFYLYSGGLGLTFGRLQVAMRCATNRSLVKLINDEQKPTSQIAVITTIPSRMT